MQRSFPLRSISALWLLMLAGAASAATGPQLFTVCVACHGARGEGNPALGAPAVAGQQPAYVQRQLRNFRAGLRGTRPGDTFGAQMRNIALAVRDDPSVVLLATYVGGLPRTTVKPPAAYDAQKGKALYQSRCAACHGVKAEGLPALGTPRLTGLHPVYIKRQLASFRGGLRGAYPADAYGKQMAAMTANVPAGKDLDDLIAFVNSL